MSFLTNESPSRVMSMLSVAISSLTLLMVINISEISFAEVETAMNPAEQAYSSVLAQAENIPSVVNEAVYATALHLGVLPESQSVYTAVDFPPARHLNLASGQGVVAGAYAEGPDLMQWIDSTASPEMLTPISLIKFMLGD